jgi:membrane protein DedA with SNARE-associated domain
VPIDQIKELIYILAGWCSVLVSAAFGNPVPEEVWIAAAGGYAASMTDEFGLLRFLVLPVVIIGAFVADLLLYGLGRLFGARLLEMKWMRRLSPPAQRERIADNFHHYGFVIFILGRMVPGIRTTLFLTAGTMRLNLLRFAVADGVGSVLGGSLFFFLGYGLGSHFIDLLRNVEGQIAQYKAALIIIVLGAVAIYLLYAFLRRPIPTGDPDEVPIIGKQIKAHLPDKTDSPPTETPSGQSQRCDTDGPSAHTPSGDSQSSEAGTQTEARR